MVHDFEEKSAQGDACAELIDEYLNKRFNGETEVVELEIDKLGIDRLWQVGRARHSLEYKSDFKADETGNAFVELESVAGRKAGWAYTCMAQYLFYFIPPRGEGFLIEMTQLKRRMPVWMKHMKRAKAFNEGYHSVGLLVPLNDFVALAVKRFDDMPIVKIEEEEC